MLDCFMVEGMVTDVQPARKAFRVLAAVLCLLVLSSGLAPAVAQMPEVEHGLMPLPGASTHFEPPIADEDPTITPVDENQGMAGYSLANIIPTVIQPLDDETAAMVPTIQNAGLFVDHLVEVVGQPTSALLPELNGAQADSALASLVRPFSPEPRMQGLDPGYVVVKVGKKDGNLRMFTSSDQVFCGSAGGSDSVMLYGSRGTTISSTERVVRLHTGRLVSDCGSASLIIETAVASVKVEPQSTAVLDVRPGKPVRILAVGGNEDAVAVTTADGASFRLMPGEEMVVGDHDLTEEELIPADGLTREPVAGGIESTTRKLRRTKISVDEFARKEMAAGARNIRLAGSARYGHRLVGHVADAARAQKPYLKSDTWTGAVRPDSPARHAREPLQILASDGTMLTQPAENCVDFAGGSAFLRCPDRTTIRTPVATVHAERGAMLVIEGTTTKVRVKALSGPDEVWVEASGTRIPLSPGKEVLLTAYRPCRQEALPADGVARRQLTALALDRDLTAVVGEFSLPSLLKSADCLDGLRHARTVSERALIDRLIKTAAAVEFSTGKHGRYFIQARQVAAGGG